MVSPVGVLEEGADTYETKNSDYNEAYRTGGEILWKIAGERPIELSSAEDMVSFGLYTRRLDKISRAFVGEFVNDELNHEPVVDSHKDACVYGAIHAAQVSNREPAADSIIRKFREAIKGGIRKANKILR